MVGEYERSVKKFVKNANWLTPTDEPMLVHLKNLARSLDQQLATSGEVTGALAKDFGVTWGRLAKQKPVGDVPLDSDDEDLQFS